MPSGPFWPLKHIVVIMSHFNNLLLCCLCFSINWLIDWLINLQTSQHPTAFTDYCIYSIFKLIGFLFLAPIFCFILCYSFKLVFKCMLRFSWYHIIFKQDALDHWLTMSVWRVTGCQFVLQPSTCKRKMTWHTLCSTLLQLCNVGCVAITLSGLEPNVMVIFVLICCCSMNATSFLAFCIYWVFQKKRYPCFNFAITSVNVHRF